MPLEFFSCFQPLSHPRFARLTAPLDNGSQCALSFLVQKAVAPHARGAAEKCNYYVLNRLVGNDIGLCIENHSEHYERIDEVDNTIAVDVAGGYHIVGKLLKLHDGTH